MPVIEATNVDGTGRSEFDGLAKDWFGSMWEDHVNTELVIASLIGKTRGRMGGRRVLSAVVDGYPQSAGFGALENQNFMTPSSLSAFQPELITRSVYIILQWTGQVEDMARAGDKAAFAGPRATELRMARKQYAINKARMLYLGPYQPLGKQDGAIGAGSVVTLFGRNTRGSAVGDFFKHGAHYFRKGMAVQWGATGSTRGNPVTGHASEEITVTAVDNSAGTITLSSDGATAPVNNGYFWPWGAHHDFAMNSGISATGTATPDNSRDSMYSGYNGLGNLILDSNIYAHVYGETRSTRPTLSGQRTADGSATDFDELQVTLAVDKIVDDGPGEEPDTLLLHRSTRREVVQDNKNDKRYPTVVTKSGFRGLSYVSGDRPMPYKADRDCQPGLIYILRKGTFGHLRNRALSSIDKSPERFVQSKDAHQVVMAERGNYFCTAPFGNGTLEDIAFDVTAVTAT